MPISLGRLAGRVERYGRRPAFLLGCELRLPSVVASRDGPGTKASRLPATSRLLAAWQSTEPSPPRSMAAVVCRRRSRLSRRGVDHARRWRTTPFAWSAHPCWCPRFRRSRRMAGRPPAWGAGRGIGGGKGTERGRHPNTRGAEPEQHVPECSSRRPPTPTSNAGARVIARALAALGPGMMTRMSEGQDADVGRAPICPSCGVTALPAETSNVIYSGFVCENPDCDAFGNTVES